jgi:hypothetical protein
VTAGALQTAPGAPAASIDSGITLFYLGGIRREDSDAMGSIISAARNRMSVFVLGSSLCAVLSPAQQANPPHPVLARYGLGASHPAAFRLPRELREASGLAATADGRLFCHNDERGVVFQVDPESGLVLKQFSAGGTQLRGDFEGIAVADSSICIVTSAGDIYIFSEPREGEQAPVQVHETGLGPSYDIEGLCYDPDTRALLLACKENPSEKSLRCVYSFSLRTFRLDRTPRFTIDRKKIEKEFGIRHFRPTSIERHPQSGTFLILSSSDPAVIELSRSGTLIAAVRLNESVHPQPEGLAVGPDLTLYICNEGKDRGTLIRYPYIRPKD